MMHGLLGISASSIIKEHWQPKWKFVIKSSAIHTKDVKPKKVWTNSWNGARGDIPRSSRRPGY